MHSCSNSGQRRSGQRQSRSSRLWCGFSTWGRRRYLRAIPYTADPLPLAQKCCSGVGARVTVSMCAHAPGRASPCSCGAARLGLQRRAPEGGQLHSIGVCVASAMVSLGTESPAFPWAIEGTETTPSNLNTGLGVAQDKNTGHAPIPEVVIDVLMNSKFSLRP